MPVPFTPQAPTGNWDQLHNEACEEAAAYMAAAYFIYPEGSISAPGTDIPAKDFEKALANMTAWEDKAFGYHLDTTAAETAQMMGQLYGLKTKMINDFTADDIKKELAQGHVVIISENGRLLGNPYYKRPGPIHHMLVIKGFGGDTLITNDSGTRRGLDYRYDFKTIYDAAADWDRHSGTTDTSIKTAIAVWK